jgi:hypothetical protein
MTTKTKVFFSLPFLLTILVGCHSDTPKSPTVQTPSSVKTQPKPEGCDTISDPVAAEDCRFRAEVLKKREKSNASPVVKHAPGTIQQP